MKALLHLNDLYKFSNSPCSIVWNAGHKNEPRDRNRCMVSVASKTCCAGSTSRSGQNWKFHNVQSPTLSTVHTPADNARPSPLHPPTGTHLVSPCVQIPYLNQYLIYTRINELLVNNLPSPHLPTTPPPSAPANQ